MCASVKCLLSIKEIDKYYSENIAKLKNYPSGSHKGWEVQSFLTLPNTGHYCLWTKRTFNSYHHLVHAEPSKIPDLKKLSPRSENLILYVDMKATSKITSCVHHLMDVKSIFLHPKDGNILIVLPNALHSWDGTVLSSGITFQNEATPSCILAGDYLINNQKGTAILNLKTGKENLYCSEISKVFFDEPFSSCSHSHCTVLRDGMIGFREWDEKDEYCLFDLKEQVVTERIPFKTFGIGSTPIYIEETDRFIGWNRKNPFEYLHYDLCEFDHKKMTSKVLHRFEVSFQESSSSDLQKLRILLKSKTFPMMDTAFQPIWKGHLIFRFQATLCAMNVITGELKVIHTFEFSELTEQLQGGVPLRVSVFGEILYFTVDGLCVIENHDLECDLNGTFKARFGKVRFHLRDVFLSFQ